MLRVEDIACRRVVNDDGLSQIAPDLAKILHIVALVIVTAFSEKPVMHDMMNVQLIEERVAVLRDGCREDDNFVELTDAFEEGVHARPFDDVNVVILAFDFNGYREVRLV